MRTPSRPLAKTFRPWWYNCCRAGGWLLGAVAVLVLTFAYAASTSPSPAPLLGLLAAAVGAFVARRTGAADALGVTASASRYPHALSSSAPQPPFVFAAGDVDLLIRTKRHGFVVEIKSRHVWDGSRHNRAAVDQAKTLLRAFADTESRAWQAVV